VGRRRKCDKCVRVIVLYFPEMRDEDEGPAATYSKKQAVCFAVGAVAGTLLSAGLFLTATGWLVGNLGPPRKGEADLFDVFMVLGMIYYMPKMVALIGIVLSGAGIVIFASMGLWKLNAHTFKRCEEWSTIVGAVFLAFIVLDHTTDLLLV
jgi:hypothetical protein